MAIPAKAIKAQQYVLYGSIGSFSILPQAKWKIFHFSTKASASNESDGGNCLSLLRELKPMRERVEASKINDMSSLLQRDLSDKRVANELIPYLMNNDAGIGFFPGVLVALMPKNFLLPNVTTPEYPKRALASEDTGSALYDFHSFWRLTQYKVDEKLISLGEISIDPDKTDLIVLDGQHRANAFRYATNTFKDATDEGEIYSIFYKVCQKPPEAYDAELPVTLVWFESTSDEAISPLIISRRLFVDVNTNAKPVNESRNILLDDQKIPALCTQNFYTTLAENSFQSDQLSLLQSSFDAESDDSLSKLSLFTPKILMYANSMFGLGNDEYNDLGCSISKDYWRHQKNTNRILKILKPSKHKKLPDLLKAPINQHELFPVLSSTYNKYVNLALNQFILVKKHLEALKELEDWVHNQSTTIKDVWDKVYCGGEGLFSNLRSLDTANFVNKKVSAPYVKAIDEIEKQFLDLRRKKFDSSCTDLVDSAYSTFATQACITGYLMALSVFAEAKGWEYDKDGEKTLACEAFIEYLNLTTPANWVKILTKYKEKAAGPELNPKKWPAMRNIFLRVIQNNAGGAYF